MKIKNIVLAISLLSFFSVTYAATTNNIAELFPYAAQSHHKEGEVKIESGANIKGSNNYQLDFKENDNEDDVKGKCDGKRCTLTNNFAPSYRSSWNSDWKWGGKWQQQHADLPQFKDINAGGSSFECDYNENKNAILTDVSYQNIVVKSNCTIAAPQAVTIKEKVEINGSGTLYLEPGDYWVKEIDIKGSGKIKSTRSGAVNLYVKNKIDLGSQPLGTAASPVNIYHYDNDSFKLNSDVVGSISTLGKLEMNGSSSLDRLIQAKSVELQGSAKLTLLPGDYWLEKFDISGAAQIIQPQAGDVNLHVKEKVSVKVGKLGRQDRRVNINNHNENVDLGKSLTWYGDLNTHDDLELHGSSQFYGAVRAKSLDLQGSAELYLTAGEYWYEDIELQGSSKIKLVGDRLTHLHILDELDLEGSTHLNHSGESLVVFVYGDDDDKDDGNVDLQGSSTINGHLYVQGEVELQGSSKIYGAVNTVDLEMEGSSAIIYRELAGVSSQLSHYQLDYIGNSKSGSVSLTACADDSDDCRQYQDEVTDVVVRDAVANEDFVSFNSFTGLSQPQSITINNCVEFSLDTSEPWPSSSPPLRCFMNGQQIANCKVCDEPIPLYGYVFGQAEIPQLSANDAEQFEIVSYEGPAGLAYFNDTGKHLEKGTKLTLPLFVTLEQAGVIDLVFQDEDKRDYPVTLRFAPKSLAWDRTSGTNGCGDNAFEYASHNESCVVLGAAGDQITLILQAYGEEDANGQPQRITNYQDALASEKIKVEVTEIDENHDAYVPTSKSEQVFNFVSRRGKGHQVYYTPEQVSLIKATVQGYYTFYGKNDDGAGVKLTSGDSVIVGRSVPSRLHINKVTPGKILDDVAYRAKPLELSLPPAYEVIGCVAGNRESCVRLPSYSGEFAKGLKLADSLEFVVVNDENDDLSLINNTSGTVTLDMNNQAESEVGTHIIEPDPALELSFAKTTPKSAENIEQKLRLNISIATDSVPQNGYLLGSGDAALAENTELRYGFLTLGDLELPVGEGGDMETTLQYYDKDNTKAADGAFSYVLPADTVPVLDPATVPSPQLSVSGTEVNVSAYDQPWEGEVQFKVPTWLQPDSGSEWIDSARLTITSDAGKRGNDRVFNRREVVR